MRNNVFKGNLGAGIQISDEDSQTPTGYLVEDNDIRENYFGFYIWNFGKCFPDERVLHLINNTVTGNIGGDIWCGEGWILPPPP